MFRFLDTERLKSKKETDHVYRNGKKIKDSCLTMIYQPVQNQIITFKVCFIVPKRLFKKAVDRNLLRRRMKEAYRLNKHTFIDKLDGAKYQLLFIYNHHEKKPYAYIENRINKLLNQMV